MLNNTIKLQVFTAIINMPEYLGKYNEYDGILTFLNKIWDLKEMPSQDSRFKNAYDDTYQHIINNDDWTTEFLYLERFNLINGDEKYFILFIENVVSPLTRRSKEEIIHFVSMINSIIQPGGFKLILTDYFEGLPVYKYRDSKIIDDLPIDIIENSIPIYLRDNYNQKNYPCFVLGYDNWDDYGNKTTFHLTYCYDSNKFTYIGKVKIMKEGNNTTWDTMPKLFTTLSNEFCSLGLSKDYYAILKEILRGNFNSFLLALRDVAIFPKIYEQFEKNEIFTASLLRGNIIERLARTVRYEIEGVSPDEYYKFNYTHKPPYADNTITLNFDFEYNTDYEHRIYAIIGKNGTGKTKILSSLAKDLSENQPPSFSPRKPVYGKIFSVSYSFYDRFEIPNPDASFNYVYLGLKKNSNEWKTEDDLLTAFYISVESIKKKGLQNEWYEILQNFIDIDILNTVFQNEPTFLDTTNFIFYEDKFNEIRNNLSSGQNVVLFLISGILAQIRYDSLILFDEPETHLHPNAISSLLNTLFELVKKFQSFCVIATHSPLIIQEIPARNVFVMEREENIALVRSLDRESLGENLTIITQDIFGNKEIPKNFIKMIEDLILKGKSSEEIIKLLETDGLPITSNIRLYIKALLSKR